MREPTTSRRELDNLNCRVLSCRWVPIESVLHRTRDDEFDSTKSSTENTRSNSYSGRLDVRSSIEYTTRVSVVWELSGCRLVRSHLFG
jgi:hypothetical protein